MFSPARLTIKIPHSPIEQQTFRSRSFRRFVVILGCLFLFFVTLHSISLQNKLQQKLTDGYLSFHNKESTNSHSHSQRVEHGQHTLKTSGKKAGNRPASVAEQIEQQPEVVRIPFEQAVSDVVLQGWEDQWFSSATFDYEGYGPLPEPVIDFVYNCR